MSAHRRPVVISPEAQADYDDILLYGATTWGDAQATRYQTTLDLAMEEVGNFPEIGQQCHDLYAGCRRLPVERHVVFYRIETDAVEIVRILHERIDATRHLPR